METLHIFSAGAAQAVVARLAQQFQQETACTVQARYGAVQSMKAHVLAGEPADVIVLTDVLIDELAGQALVVPGSRVDLGAVGTGLAVRAGESLPDVASLAALRASLLLTQRLICPDPAAATAGKVLLQVLAHLGIAEELRPRLVYCRSGYDAMAELARGTGLREIGVMQMTEIIAGEGVALAGPLPPELQSTAIYSVGLAAKSRLPARAADFIRRLTGERTALRAAGFGDCASHRAAPAVAASPLS